LELELKKTWEGIGLPGRKTKEFGGTLFKTGHSQKKGIGVLKRKVQVKTRL